MMKLYRLINCTTQRKYAKEENLQLFIVTAFGFNITDSDSDFCNFALNDHFVENDNFGESTNFLGLISTVLSCLVFNQTATGTQAY